jgi:hypothetical protein
VKRKDIQAGGRILAGGDVCAGGSGAVEPVFRAKQGNEIVPERLLQDEARLRAATVNAGLVCDEADVLPAQGVEVAALRDVDAEWPWAVAAAASTNRRVRAVSE